MFVNHKIKRGVANYAHVSLNAQLINTLSNSAFEESIWCQFNILNTTGFIGMYSSSSTIEQNVKVCFSLLELDNKSMSINDEICIMGDFNYPNIKWNGVVTHVRDLEFAETISDVYP